MTPNEWFKEADALRSRYEKDEITYDELTDALLELKARYQGGRDGEPHHENALCLP